jgi:hypothetical protein
LLDNQPKAAKLAYTLPGLLFLSQVRGSLRREAERLPLKLNQPPGGGAAAGAGAHSERYLAADSARNMFLRDLRGAPPPGSSASLDVGIMMKKALTLSLAKRRFKVKTLNNLTETQYQYQLLLRNDSSFIIPAGQEATKAGVKRFTDSTRSALNHSTADAFR